MSMGEIENSSDRQWLVVSIEEKLTTTPTISQIWERRCCIYRAPKLLRKVNEEAYTPVLVSIGPFHHKNERLRPMNAHKLIYLRSFIEESNTRLNPYLEIIKNKETEIRQCYAEPIHMDRDEFIQMILIDSIFVIELLRTRELVMPFTKGEILHDLRLAENQLPFFILKDLYSAAFIKPHDDMSSTSTESFTHLACTFFGVDTITNEAESSCCHFLDLLRSPYLSFQPRIVDEAASSCCHLLDLMRCCYLLSQRTNVEKLGERSKDSTIILCPTATRLYEAGVKFCAKDTTTCSVLDIHFDRKKGILTIPMLQVEDSTESRLMNLVAFEQCHYKQAEAYITHYHYFMDCLINTKEDVQLLVNAGIIENWLSTDQQVADLFNTLVSHAYISAPDYYYASIAKQLDDHCNKRWNRYRAILKHNYFNHPWAVLSVIYAVILLLLAIAQVVLDVPGVKK